MFQSAILPYIKSMISYVPVLHWVAIGAIAFFITLLLVIRRKLSLYGSIVFGVTAFVGLFLLEEAVVIRYCDIFHHGSGYSIKTGFIRLFHGNENGLAEIVSNIIAFIPFGLLLSEFLASAKRFSARSRLGFTILAGFGLSLCIECLQLVLRVGFFELMDLVMNTLGAFIGATLAMIARSLYEPNKKKSR